MRAEHDRILLAHGGGGSLSGRLVREVFLPAFQDPALARLGDSAVVGLMADRIALTTDAFVVSPLFFPGGDIGTLAVAGTVNDLAVAGAVPQYLTCAFVLEEGFPIAHLRRIVASMAATAAEAGVRVVAGDTKVVEHGKADGVYITTAGVGALRELPVGWGRPAPGDAIVVSGQVGSHGFAVLAAREGLRFETPIESDCAPLHSLVAALFDNKIAMRFLRDATRGGVAAVTNELATGNTWGVALESARIPVAPAVRSLGELLGIDPLYSANEGTLIVVVSDTDAQRALEVMRATTQGAQAAVIGRIEEGLGGLVTLDTELGGRRILDMPLGEQLPRIC
ncbi:MAG: hydrogenase expression/formation protein HypE [Thermoleophilia bacterium]